MLPEGGEARPVWEGLLWSESNLALSPAHQGNPHACVHLSLGVQELVFPITEVDGNETDYNETAVPAY